MPEDEEIKTVSDVRLDRIEQMLKALTEQNAKLTEQNAELQKANKELYSYAANNTIPQTPTTEAAPAVEVGAEQKAEALKAEQKKTFDEIYKLTMEKLGYPSSQTDGM